MSWFGDFGKFAQFNLSDQWDKVKKNPERPFIGAMDEGIKPLIGLRPILVFIKITSQ